VRRGFHFLYGCIIAALLGAITGGVMTVVPATALSGSEFDAGYIISDDRFFDAAAMNEGQVQRFLEDRVPRCAAGNGYPCLRDFRTATSNKAAAGAGHCNAYQGEPNESAARIIVKVAQACGINPQVLIVMLQKEQTLITSTSPTAYMYRSAMGYACPDTAPCDAQYYGFFNQVYNAAWQFRQYTLHPGGRAYRVGNSTVQYHPNAACGASTVNIRNQATANLYLYTPYQPNAAALSNLYGSGDTCSSYGNRNFWRMFNDWFGRTTVDLNSPLGNVDSVKVGPSQAYISGWTFDPNTHLSIDVHVYLNGTSANGQWGGSFRADRSRPDIAAAYPAYGQAHGFDIALNTGGRDTSACLYGYNLGAGSHLFMGCYDLKKPTGNPIGNVENATRSGNTVTVTGWTIDPDTANPIDVHAYLGEYPGGTWAGLATANGTRRDVGAANRGYGDAHGFSVKVTIPVGTSDVCIYGIGADGAGNSMLGCKTVSTASGPPVGNIESATATLGSATLTGWTIDPDTAASIDVHAYVNGRWGGIVTANGDRPDVGRAYPGYGNAHGFTAKLAVPSGRSEVCLYGYNVRFGQNSLLGCRTVNAPTGDPIGNVESATPVTGGIQVVGWSIDPDVAGPVTMHAYVDGKWGGAFTADIERADIARAYPAYGGKHGFQYTVPTTPGTHSVCINAINIQGGSSNPQLACRTVTVP
jgi:hypothetical protein